MNAKTDNAESSLRGAQVAMPASVLYLCNHNIIRSPMAEALTRNSFGSTVFAASAGVRTGDPDPFVGAVMSELGIDLQERTPQALEHLEDTWFDLIVTLSPTAHHIALQRQYVDAEEIEYWPAGDPTVVQGSRQQVLSAYRDVRDRLQERILERFGAARSRSGNHLAD